MSGFDPNVPRMELNTALVEPPLDADEATMLAFAIDRSRAQFAWKVGGLGADALRRAFPPSAMTLGGLIKHLTRVEDEQREVKMLGGGYPVRWHPLRDDPEWDWRSAAQDDPDELYAAWVEASARTRAVTAELLADGGGDRLTAWVVGDGLRPTMRRVLLDFKEEYARHTGHADLFREAIDGLVGEDPPGREFSWEQ